MSEQHEGHRWVELRYGYSVDLGESDGFDHLFQAIIGETVRLAGVVCSKKEHRSNWGEIYTECLYEIHYVAGQLKRMNSSISLDLLMEEFPVFWDRLSDRLTSGE